jgi:hypothetical protein
MSVGIRPGKGLGGIVIGEDPTVVRCVCGTKGKDANMVGSLPPRNEPTNRPSSYADFVASFSIRIAMASMITTTPEFRTLVFAITVS